ncbi:Ethanolamine kinase 2 [Orchesella cincta]|uniref:ethanolamine kinase n=1 Tax=Orchesella cincta TaxID=48709 RepID=A0A1D2N4L4_ORCCI|nr:Ethanolamine kinase 2 [Orchesella cincta]
MSKVPFVAVRIDEQSIPTGAKEVLRIVRPQWTSTSGESNIKSKVFTDGLSNKLVGFFVDDNKEDVVIVKVFGINTDVVIDRKAEIETMRLLHERKCGAEVYATFDNGICYQYMNGVTLEVEDCQEQEVFPLVAAEMARMHSDIRKDQHQNLKVSQSNGSHHENAQVNGTNTFTTNGVGKQNGFHLHHKSQIWKKMKLINKLGEEILISDPEFRQKLENVGVVPGSASDAINELELLLESQDMPVTFCHNDLIPRNIVYDEKKGKITFIDVEYAMYNYAAFDVANHFLEFAGIDQIDYSKYPDVTFRHKWIREYLKNLKLGHYPEELTVEKFDSWVQLCVPVSHLFWSVWGIYQAKHSTIDFDYLGYVGLRFSEYRKLIDNLRNVGSIRDIGNA